MGSRFRGIALWGGLAALVGSWPAGDASAATRIFKTSNSGAQVGTVTTLLNLGEGNGTAFTIDVPASARLAIFFNAECATDMLDSGDFVDIDLRVDSVVIPPSTGGNALCAGGTGGGIDNWVTGASDGVTDVSAGTRTIEVEVELFGESPGDQWWIDDLSLIVILDEL